MTATPAPAAPATMADALSLCTTLPPLPPSLEDSPYWVFSSPMVDDRVFDCELDLLHLECQRDGLPYTVQHQPIVPMEDRDPDDWSQSYLEQRRMERALRSPYRLEWRQEP